jgi:methyl-accepting chemotaxis protein
MSVRGSIRRRFMILAALGVFLMASASTTLVAFYEKSNLEGALRHLSRNELTSLQALVETVMAQRPDDSENVGIKIFNFWFDARNRDYPGKLWSVWSPPVQAYMRDSGATTIKTPRDPVDEEAMRTGEPVGRFIDGYFRYSMPVVLGKAGANNREVCFSCHGGMGLKEGDTIAVLSSSLRLDAEQAAYERMLAYMVSIGGLASVALVVAIGMVLRNVVSNPLGLATEQMRRLAKGDLGVQVSGSERGDEIGEIARAVEVFKDNALAKQDMEARERERAEAARHRVAVIEESARQFEGSISTVLSSLVNNSHTLAESSSHVARAISEAHERSDESSALSQQSSATTRDVVEAAARLEVSIGEIAKLSSESQRIATAAAAEAAQTDRRVAELGRVIGEIGEVLSLIGTVAGQTRMLALNATIEAARAGAAGQGFAVVAAEVKNLSDQSAHAADQIRAKVAAIEEQLSATVADIHGVSATIGRVDQIAGAIATAIASQQAATTEINHSIERVAATAERVAANCGRVTETVTEADNSVVAVHRASEDLSKQADSLRSEVGTFLTKVRG